MSKPLLILGLGHLGEVVAKEAMLTRKVIATTRRPEALAAIAEAGMTPVLVQPNVCDAYPDADVLVTFPPDGTTDQLLASASLRNRTVVYISTTGVYGPHAHHVTDSTPVDVNDARARIRLDAEAAWRDVGATILRAPAIYGPKSGLHLRIARGDFKMVEDGESYVSRIHVEDLAQIALAVLDHKVRGETFVIGDAEPATQRTVIEWLCERMNAPLPASVPRDEAPASLRANRRVDGTRVLTKLGLTLRYPTFRDGLDACIAAMQH